MKEIQEVIRLVRESLDAGLATTERYSHADNVTYVHFNLGDDATYVGKVEGNEPEEISIARRLMQGRLNLGMVAQSPSITPEALDVLNRIDRLRQDAGFGNGKHDAEIVFAVAIPELYTKEVLIFQNDILITVDDVQNAFFNPDQVSPQAKLAMNAAYSNESLLELDAAGAYRPVMKITVPDLFDPVDTLRALKRADFVGPKKLEEYAKVEILEGIDHEVLKSLGDASVMRMDGVDYRSAWDEITVLEGFKGAPASKPKLEKERPTSLDGPGM